MVKKTVWIGLAASAVLFFSSGAAQVANRGAKDDSTVRVSRRLGNPDARTAAVIPGPPPGWTIPVNIAHLPGSSSFPSIAVDNNGKVYAVWEEWYGGLGAPRKMVFNTNYSGSWGASQENNLSYTAIDDTGYVTVACDPSDGTAYVGFHDADWVDPRQANMEIWVMDYTKGVKTWEGWVSDTPEASDYTTLAVDPNTRELYTMWFDDWTGTSTFELLYTYRDPATRDWSYYHMVPVYVGRSKYWRDMVIDKSGTAHLVFNLRSPTEVFYTKNPTPHDDSKWTAPVPVSGNTDRDWSWPRMAVDNDGDVYVVWYANSGGYETESEEVWFRRTVGGVWQAPVNLSNSPTRSEGCTIAIDPESEDIWVVWHEFVAGASWEVYLRMYTDQAGGGKAWGDIYNMTNNAGHSAEPFIRRDPQGGLHMVYHDDAGGNQEIFYTQKPGIGAPLSVAVETTLNAAEDQKTNTVSWAANPSNASLSLTGYKVYAKKASDPDTSFALLSQVSTSTLSYVHNVSSVTERYAYRVATLTSGGAEGMSATVADKLPVFAPTGLTLTTSANKVLFYEVKDNTLTFTDTKNAAADVASYGVYRKKAKDEAAAMELVGSTPASVKSYTDVKVQGGAKYAYALKTKFKDGREGNLSAAVTEK